jgi:hypothetical protein
MQNAGRLEPGATYVYERANGVTYARKLGDPPDQRFEVGRDYDGDVLYNDLQEARLWGDICRAAKHNPALQDALDRVKLVHALSNQDDSILHHPV